jgi:hypothetical protein
VIQLCHHEYIALSNLIQMRCKGRRLNTVDGKGADEMRAAIQDESRNESTIDLSKRTNTAMVLEICQTVVAM